MEVPAYETLLIERLGQAQLDSPLNADSTRFVDEQRRVTVSAEADDIRESLAEGGPLPSFELAGPRRKVFFSPQNLVCGIVTCGGICPGLNNVIRSITLTLFQNYGVQRVLGFRYGYAGLAPDAVNPPLELAAERVDDIQELPGTILGSSRGPVPAEAMLETLRNYGVKILFTVGGDGTLRGASALAAEIKRQKLSISVIGVPKTIDNDLNWLMRSFGFSTAVDAATRVLDAAHCEAKCAWNGIGLVKLMGRHSGFIAAHATVASGIVNFCLVPEVPFSLEGKNGFLNVLEQRMQRKHHAVVVAAEGAGQDLIQTGGPVERDASGNVRFKDIGAFLKAEIEGHFARRSIPVNVRYIDPSYTIRGLPASAVDAEFCVSLGQHAVHAGMSGRTDMVVGAWNQHYTHVPIKAVVESRKQIDTQSPIWQTVLNTTHQPACMIG